DALRDIRTLLEQIQQSQKDWAEIAEATRRIRQLRNTIVHTLASSETQDKPRPAYSLDGDDDA
ncbi:hypothetical protein, partial [Agrobacterium sp.]|uniref:hypothetical protein n=1 Tax=Agrobacterium sp. TaxID=361 RepID=UPI00391876AC